MSFWVFCPKLAEQWPPPPHHWTRFEINHIWKPKIDTSCCKLRKSIDLAEMQLWMLMLASSLRSTVIGLLTSSSSGVWNDGGECGGWQKGNRVADPARILPWIATSRKDKNNSQRSNCAGTAGGGVPSWEIHLPHMFSPLWTSSWIWHKGSLH